MDNLSENVTTSINASNFTVIDYTLFLLMLLSSALIGLYFGCFGKKQSSADEYLLGGKEMNAFPIAMSLTASFMSGISMLGVPADVYAFGATYGLLGVVIPLNIVFALHVYVPVFFKLQLSSTYEYLSIRFGKGVRLFASFLFALHLFLYLPIVIYIPALALAQATGFNVHFITSFVCGVCIFYTTIGGLKSVVWTDTLQFIVTIGATAVVTHLGTKAQGGVLEVLRTSVKGHRLELDYDIDPTKRDTFWTVFIGLFFRWILLIGTGQECIQKCLALPTIGHVKKAFYTFGVGLTALTTCIVYMGLLIYDKFSDCDPLVTKQITRSDQLLPYYVLEVAGQIPGLPGLFIAGVVSASLSTLSSSLNSLSCTIFEDFVTPYTSKDMTQKQISYILKFIVLIVGILCTLLVFVAEHLGNLLPLGISLGGVTNGAALGLFTFGMLYPLANNKGALSGGIGSIIIMTWIVFGSQYYKLRKEFWYEKKPVSVEGCTYAFNTTLPRPEPEFVPWAIYRVSHYYYTMMGTILVFLIGVPVSMLTRKKDQSVNKDLISPVMHWALPDESKSSPDYKTVKGAAQMLKLNDVS